MSDPFTAVTLALAALAAVAMVVGGGLAGWRGWLQLKRSELERSGGPVLGAASRIEIADLRERVRKLEAIAAGVEL